LTIQHVAAYLNLSFANPLYWPVPALKRLLRLHEQQGYGAFQRRVLQMMSRGAN